MSLSIKLKLHRFLPKTNSWLWHKTDLLGMKWYWMFWEQNLWPKSWILRGYLIWSYLGSKTSTLKNSMRGSVFDDFGFCHQNIHQISSRHEIKQKVKVIFVLEASILSYAKWVSYISGNGLFTENMFWACHNCRLLHPFQGILPFARLLCTQKLAMSNQNRNMIWLHIRLWSQV